MYDKWATKMKTILSFVAGLTVVAGTLVPLHTAAPQTAAATAPLPDPKSTMVPRIEGEVNIDGVLDEQPWQKAARLTPFVQHDTMGTARVRTEVRIWYDQAALYLGWICEDGDIQATLTGRDRRFWEEEVVEFFVTPAGLDRYFELQWNPLGGSFDAIIQNEIGSDGRSVKFQGDWSVHGRQHDPRCDGGRLCSKLERPRPALDSRGARSFC